MSAPYGTSPLAYQGIKEKNPPNLFFFDRAPNERDLKLFDLGDVCIDKSTDPRTIYMLVDKAFNTAIWAIISTKAAPLDTLTSDVGIITPIDGNISILGDATQGVSTSGIGAVPLTISVDNATTTSKGVAQFNPTDFSVAGGVVSSLGAPAFIWTRDTLNPTALIASTGHISVSGSLLTYTLPATCAIGDEFSIVAATAAGFLIRAGSSQTIRFGNQITALEGSVTSTSIGNSVDIICINTNSEFLVKSSMGNFIII